MPRSIAGRWCCLRRGSWRYSEHLDGLQVDLPATTSPDRATGDPQPLNVYRTAPILSRSCPLWVTCGRRVGKNFLTFLRHWSVRSRVRPVDAADVPLALMLCADWVPIDKAHSKMR